MGRPLRHFEPGIPQFITSRCFQGRYLLKPSKEVNKIIGGILARAVEQYDIELYSFVFTSNHFHLLAKGPDKNPCLISNFVGYLKSNISKELSRLDDRKWQGTFFDRRFSAEPVLDDEAMQGRLQYILSHGVKEGLVSKVEDWPGLSSLPEHLGVEREFSWQDRTAWYHMLGSKKGLEVPVINYSLKISKLPMWKNEAQETIKDQISQLINEINSESSTQVFGVNKLLAQNPKDMPKDIQRIARPLCHASSPDLYEEYKRRYEEFVSEYRQISFDFRKGDVGVEFPPHSFRPAPPAEWQGILYRLKKPQLIKLEPKDAGYEGTIQAA